MSVLSESPANLKLFIFVVVFLVLSWAVFGLRIWARWLRAQRFQVNDWLLFGALIAQIGWALSDLLSLTAGGGSVALQNKGSAAAKAYSSKLSLLGQTMWGTSLYLSKMSVLDFYVRIFKVHRRFGMLCWVMMGFVSVCYVVYTTSVLLSCIPLRKIWDPTVPGGCLGKERSLVGTSFNAALDFVIVLLPTPVVWRLKMRRSRRFLVSLAFSAGLIVTVLSVLRIYWQVHPEANNLAYSVITQLEPDLSSIAATIPLLQPVLSRLVNKLSWFHLETGGFSVSGKTGSGAEKPVLGSQAEQDAAGEGARVDPTASERLRQHLWHIPEMNETTGNATTRDDLESAISSVRYQNVD